MDTSRVIDVSTRGGCVACGAASAEGYREERLRDWTHAPLDEQLGEL